MSHILNCSADITILIPTSPIPSHPSRAILSATIAAARESLPDSPIILTCDGSDDLTYREYCSHLGGLWPNTTVIHFAEHVHQSGMLPEALRRTTTPFIYYLEHDWSTLPGVPWDTLTRLLRLGYFHSIKLHANPRISPYYEHLMLDRVMYQGSAFYDRYQDHLHPAPAYGFIQTLQWSQNPHIATTDFYCNTILPLVDGKCDFIENIVHGLVGGAPWDTFRTAIYNPCDGDMIRIRHLDGKNTQL